MKGKKTWNASYKISMTYDSDAVDDYDVVWKMILLFRVEEEDHPHHKIPLMNPGMPLPRSRKL